MLKTEVSNKQRQDPAVLCMYEWLTFFAHLHFHTTISASHKYARLLLNEDWFIWRIQSDDEEAPLRIFLISLFLQFALSSVRWNEAITYTNVLHVSIGNYWQALHVEVLYIWCVRWNFLVLWSLIKLIKKLYTRIYKIKVSRIFLTQHASCTTEENIICSINWQCHFKIYR